MKQTLHGLPPHGRPNAQTSDQADPPALHEQSLVQIGQVEEKNSGEHPPAGLPSGTALWRQREYRLLWSARTVSITGSEVSRLAVPLTAVTLLAASPLQMGLLTAATALPALLLGLQSGAIADRVPRRRPLMIACELVSATAALTVPLAWLLGLLTIPWLVTVALIIGTAGVLFRATNFPFITAVVAPHQRTEALAGFQTSYSLASIT